MELTEDKHALAYYEKDRKKALAESGLTKAQQKIVLSDDLEKIRDAVREEYKSAKVIIIAMFVLHLPHPPKK